MISDLTSAGNCCRGIKRARSLSPPGGGKTSASGPAPMGWIGQWAPRTNKRYQRTKESRLYKCSAWVGRAHGVIPVAVERVALDADGCELGVGDFNFRGLPAWLWSG